MNEILTVSKSYDIEGYQAEILHDINFTVEKGDFVSIMGTSGSGKTALLNCISGIDEAISHFL